MRTHINAAWRVHKAIDGSGPFWLWITGSIRNEAQYTMFAKIIAFQVIVRYATEDARTGIKVTNKKISANS
jgi:hypothetical protein